jgi:hypothetical protein
MHAPKAQVAPGDLIDGRYHVEDPLGTGGMAIVYRARHTGTQAPCALKLVHPHLVTRRELVQLLLKEARVGGRIGKSPHVVEVLDAGFDQARGVPYIAMELLEGETLEEWCERHGPMPPALVRVVFEQLADALEQAHRAGVVHRDLKPSNLFLTAGRRGAPVLKVMDFGIAKVLESESLRTATQIGTPAYAAPEQMGATMRDLASRQGIVVAASVSVATDVWPLGLIAYELLTGLPVGQFWGAELTAEIPVKAALYPRDAPSARAGDRAALLPPGFDAWFARATRTDAAERWPSVGEAAAALGCLLDAVPLPAPPPAPVAWVGAPPPRTDAPQEAPAVPRAGSRRHVARWMPVAGLAAGIGLFTVGAGVAVLIAPRLGHGPAAEACRASAARCDEACDGGDAESCTHLGLLTERGEGAPRDDARAAMLYRRACDGGDLAGCAGLGRLHRAGRGGLARDPVRAVGLFQRACDGGVARGCAQLGEAYRDGAGGLGRDLVRAVALFQSACDRGDLAGCKDLGGMHQLGKGGLARDDARAAALYQKACDGGELVGCSDLGVLVGAGKGGLARDEALAVTLYARACDGGEMLGCNNLGMLHEHGADGLARDEARAVALYRQACEGGAPSGCGSLGGMYEAGRGGVPLDIARARSLYQQACDGGDPVGCRRLGALYEYGKGGLARDDARAVALYQRACDGEDLHGCNGLGFMVENGRGGLARDEARAAALYQRACDGGDLLGCSNFGVMLAAGRGVARDQSRAVALYQRACEGGVADGCASLGWAYLSGGGAPRDTARGLELLRKACAAGNAWSCERVAELQRKRR